MFWPIRERSKNRVQRGGWVGGFSSGGDPFDVLFKQRRSF